MLKVKGSGDEYQSWNSDQASGMRNNSDLGTVPVGALAPVSASAIIASAANESGVVGLSGCAMSTFL